MVLRPLSLCEQLALRRELTFEPRCWMLTNCWRGPGPIFRNQLAARNWVAALARRDMAA